MTTNTHADQAATDLWVEDAALALELAREAGVRLLRVREELAEIGAAAGEVKAAGDAASQQRLAELLRTHRPDDAVLSEEAADESTRLTASRVWIIDPLDGTREFSEPERSDWAVHVALWVDGELKASAVTMPAAALEYATHLDLEVPERVPGPIRLAVSRTRPPEFVRRLAEHLGAELVPMGSAGVKATSVIRGEADAYVHAGGQFEWDSAAPVAVARAAGLHASRVDGSPLVYNREDPRLPDLVICRPELRATILQAIAAVSGNHEETAE